jgi:hypothetical protein
MNQLLILRHPAVLLTAAMLVGLLLAGPGICGAPAVISWFDNFNDGDAEDGSPLTWAPHPATPGDYNATSGDYVLTPPTPFDQDESMATTVEPFANPGLSPFTDVSVRTRGVLLTNEGNLLVVSRFAFATFSGYAAYVDHGGQLVILAVAGGAPIGLAECDPPECEQPINALTDVVLQLDAFGDDVSVTVWRPGDPQPGPTLSVVDSSFSTGSAGLAFNEDSDEGDAGIYRFAKAASVRLLDGDLDLDGDVDFDDIDDFVLGLNDPGAYAALRGLPPYMMGDTDNDGDQDFDDIPVFVTILTGGAVQGVPEPSSLVLGAIGLAAVLAAARRGRNDGWRKDC